MFILTQCVAGLATAALGKHFGTGNARWLLLVQRGPRRASLQYLSPQGRPEVLWESITGGFLSQNDTAS